MAVLVVVDQAYYYGIRSHSRRIPMRALIAAFGAVVFAAGMVTGTTWSSPVDAQGFTVVMDCGGVSAPRMRTTLYFGLTRDKGAISELEWQIFLRDEVTRRFPDGLTAWDAQGQWRTAAGTIDHERSKVLLLVHPDTDEARRGVQEVITTYRKMFEQQSVLWESSRVCVTA
jgi:hypothetical protein